MKTYKKNLYLSPLALAVVYALSPQAIAQESDNKVSDQEVEVIMVTGIRASVTKALAIKRFESGVVDAISSEDIGSLPDENIAESIQRIAGVQIERDEGRGALVSLRGMGPSYVGTTLNGNALASATYDGGFRFDIVQSELASEIKIYKSPKASLQEDYLSGTIDIGTAKPLSFDESKTFIKVEANHTDVRGETTPGLGFTHLNQNDEGTFGYMLNMGYKELNSRYDLMFGQRFTGEELNGETTNADGDIPVERIDRPRYRREDTDTKRYLLSGALQYIATNNLEINVDGVLALDKRDKYLQQLVPLLNTGTTHLISSTDNTWDVFGVENVQVESGQTREMDERSSYALTTTTDWNVTDDLLLTGVVHYTAGELKYTAHQTLAALNTHLYVDMTPDDPTFITGNIPGVTGLEDVNFNPLNDPNTWQNDNLDKMRLSAQHKPSKNDEIAFQLDANYTLDIEGIDAIKAGVKVRRQTFSKSQTDHYLPEEYLVNNIIPGLRNISENYEVVDDFTHGKYPGMDIGFIVPDIYSLYSDLCYEGTCGDIEAFPTRESASAFFEMERDIFSSYVEVDFNYGGLRGDIGIRYTSTDRHTEFNGASIDYALTPEARKIIENNGGILSDERQSADMDYDNWLPSLNLAYDLTEDIVLRAGIGKVMKRPGADGGTAAFARSIGYNTDDERYSVVEGDVFKAATTGTIQNLSAEWYFNESSALTVAVFKNVYENQTVQEDACLAGFASPDTSAYEASYDAATQSCMDIDGFVYEIRRKRNTNGETTYKGYEIGYNQTFDFLPAPFNGLGLIANYTSIKADNGEDKLALTSLSEETYNLIGFYEYENFSARITLNHRSPYIMNDGFFWGNNSALGENPGKLEKERHQVDFSMGYQLTDNLNLSFDAINVNNDYENGTRYESARLQSFSTFGRTFIVKAQYQF